MNCERYSLSTKNSYINEFKIRKKTVGKWISYRSLIQYGN